MSKPNIRGALYTLVLFAAVAVFSQVANLESRNAEKMRAGSALNSDTGILTADGTSPYPRPPETGPAVS